MGKVEAANSSQSQAQHKLVKHVLSGAPNASEAYVSVEGRAPMILKTIANTPQAPLSSFMGTANAGLSEPVAS